MSTLFYTQYVGGKRTEVKHIINYIEELYNDKKINKIIEPFCGSCAVSLYCKIKNNIDVKYHMNDIDKSHIEFLQYVHNNGTKKIYKNIKKIWIDNHDHSKEYVNKLEEEYKKDPTRYDLKILLQKILFMNHAYYENSCKTRMTKIKDMTPTNDFFKNALITNDDYKKIFDMYKDDKKALLILDPPYFNSSNKDYSFSHKKEIQGNWVTGKHVGNKIIDNTNMFIDIVEMLKTARCKIILFMNGNAITKYIYKDFIKKEYEKIYARGKSCTTHLIITNF